MTNYLYKAELRCSWDEFPDKYGARIEGTTIYFEKRNLGDDTLYEPWFTKTEYDEISTKELFVVEENVDNSPYYEVYDGDNYYIIPYEMICRIDDEDIIIGNICELL